MKKADIAMLVLIASMAILVAYTVANSIPMLKVDEEGKSVQTFKEITGDIVEPSDDAFSSDSINPTVKIVIDGTK